MKNPISIRIKERNDQNNNIIETLYEENSNNVMEI